MAYDFSNLGIDISKVHTFKDTIKVPLSIDDIKKIISALSFYASNQRIDVTFTKCNDYGYITDDSLIKFNDELSSMFLLQKRLLIYLSLDYG